MTPFKLQEPDFEGGRARLCFAGKPAFENHFGNIQGAFAVAMIDVLISIAAYAKTRTWLPVVEVKSSFVAPTILGECIGEGTEMLKAYRGSCHCGGPACATICNQRG